MSLRSIFGVVGKSRRCFFATLTQMFLCDLPGYVPPKGGMRGKPTLTLPELDRLPGAFFCAIEDSFQLIVGIDVEAYAPGYTVQDMAQQEQPGPDRPREEWDAFSRQSKALNEIDEAIRSDEPADEKLKKLVEEHSDACDEIKEELAGHKAGTMPQSSPLSE
jgi:hypothetical protein